MQRFLLHAVEYFKLPESDTSYIQDISNFNVPVFNTKKNQFVLEKANKPKVFYGEGYRGYNENTKNVQAQQVGPEFRHPYNDPDNGMWIFRRVFYDFRQTGSFSYDDYNKINIDNYEDHFLRRHLVCTWTVLKFKDVDDFAKGNPCFGDLEAKYDELKYLIDLDVNKEKAASRNTFVSIPRFMIVVKGENDTDGKPYYYLVCGYNECWAGKARLDQLHTEYDYTEVLTKFYSKRDLLCMLVSWKKFLKMKTFTEVLKYVGPLVYWVYDSGFDKPLVSVANEDQQYSTFIFETPKHKRDEDLEKYYRPENNPRRTDFILKFPCLTMLRYEEKQQQHKITWPVSLTEWLAFMPHDVTYVIDDSLSNLEKGTMIKLKPEQIMHQMFALICDQFTGIQKDNFIHSANIAVQEEWDTLDQFADLLFDKASLESLYLFNVTRLGHNRKKHFLTASQKTLGKYWLNVTGCLKKISRVKVYANYLPVVGSREYVSGQVEVVEQQLIAEVEEEEPNIAVAEVIKEDTQARIDKLLH